MDASSERKLLPWASTASPVSVSTLYPTIMRPIRKNSRPLAPSACCLCFELVLPVLRNRNGCVKDV